MPQEFELPVRPFFYTLDQVASLLSITPDYVWKVIGFFQGRTVTVRTLDEIQFINIAPREQKPEWRCAETELVRFLKRKGFTVVSSRR